MLGVLFTVLLLFPSLGVGNIIAGRWTDHLERSAMTGIRGLIGLGTMGLATLLIGLIPGGLNWGFYVFLIIPVAGYINLYFTLERPWPKLRPPGGLGLLFPLAIGIALIFALTGVLAPSTPLDWDTLAYHLAVPKMWLANGQIGFVSFIHHSNFPQIVDMLFIWCLKLGGQSGAKMVTLIFTFYGVLAVHGLAQAKYGGLAGWWAALTFVTVPMVIWESGSAYIDVAHGIYAGLALWFIATLDEKNRHDQLIVAAILLGFAAGSKYTGLQTIFVAAIMAAVANYKTESGASISTALKSVGIVVGGSVAIAAPWYLKNILLTGNPVYPFFYSVFGGKNWDAFSAMIYAEEQKTFGIGTTPKLDFTAMGQSILGIAYQPGRFTNPNPLMGTGFIFVSIGAVAIGAALYWAFSGRAGKVEKLALLGVGLTLLMWFGLSQQSRYILSLLPILAILLGGATLHEMQGKALGFLSAVQAALALYIVSNTLVTARMPVLSGGLTEAEYLGGFKDSAGQPKPGQVGFYNSAIKLNEIAKGGRVALYDEVFGYFLDVPYMWANPGHTTELGYEQMRTADDLIAALKKQNITHVYLNLGLYPARDPSYQTWVAAMGLDGPAVPFTESDRADRFTDLRNRWKVLVAEAIASKKLELVETQGRHLIFKLK